MSVFKGMPKDSLEPCEFVFVIDSPPNSTIICNRLVELRPELQHINLVDELIDIVNGENTALVKTFKPIFDIDELQFIRKHLEFERDPKNHAKGAFVLSLKPTVVKYLMARIPHERSNGDGTDKAHIIINGYPYFNDWTEFKEALTSKGWITPDRTVVINMRKGGGPHEAGFRKEGWTYVDVYGEVTENDMFQEVCIRLHNVEGWEGLSEALKNTIGEKTSEAAAAGIAPQDVVGSVDGGGDGAQEKKEVEQVG